MTITDIVEQVKKLSLEERHELKQILLQMLDEEPVKKRKLSELRGLGKNIWQGVDAQEYVNQLRDEWDDNS